MLQIDKDKFNSWLLVKELSPRTIFEYGKYYDAFDFNFNQGSINNYLNRFSNCSGARAFISNLIKFVVYSEEYSDADKHQISLLSLPKRTGKRKVRLPDWITKDDVHRLASEMNEKYSIMCLLSFYGGLRVSELLGNKFNKMQTGVKPYDFNWTGWIKEPSADGKLKVFGKGEKTRIVFVPQFLMKKTYVWIKGLNKKGSRDECVFKVKQGAWKKVLYRVSQRVLSKRIHPHTFRHSCATWLLDSGWNLQEVKEYLGHSSISSTSIYTHVSRKGLEEKFKEISKHSYPK